MNAKEAVQYSLGFFVVLCAAGLIGLLLYVPIPADNKDIVNISLGTLLGSMVTIVGYFFGSSKGSAEKTELLNKP